MALYRDGAGDERPEETSPIPQPKRTKKTAAPAISHDELLAAMINFGIDSDEAEGWMGIAQDGCPLDDEDAAHHWARCNEWVQCATQEVLSRQAAEKKAK